MVQKQDVVTETCNGEGGIPTFSPKPKPSGFLSGKLNLVGGKKVFPDCWISLIFSISERKAWFSNLRSRNSAWIEPRASPIPAKVEEI